MKGKEYIEYLINKVRQNPTKNSELLYTIQKEACKLKKIPIFCRTVTETGIPIGKYHINRYGLEKAIEKMSSAPITGCPATNKTWCD